MSIELCNTITTLVRFSSPTRFAIDFNKIDFISHVEDRLERKLYFILFLIKKMCDYKYACEKNSCSYQLSFLCEFESVNSYRKLFDI